MTKREVTQLSYEIIGLAIKVHKVLGPGLLESVYERCLKYELIKNEFDVKQQMRVPVVYENIIIDTDLRLDLLVNDCVVNDCVVVELKAIETVPPVEEAKLLTYMKLLQKPQGLLINFFTDNISKSMKPFVNEHFRILHEE